MNLYRIDDWSVELSVFMYCDPFTIFSVIKTTPFGFWIDNYGSKKWVNGMAKNAFAFDTKEKALFNYMKRKESQIRILKARLATAENNLYWAKNVDLSTKRLTNMSK